MCGFRSSLQVGTSGCARAYTLHNAISIVVRGTPVSSGGCLPACPTLYDAGLLHYNVLLEVHTLCVYMCVQAICCVYAVRACVRACVYIMCSYRCRHQGTLIAAWRNSRQSDTVIDNKVLTDLDT